MADAKISALAAVTTLDGTEVVPIVQGGTTMKMSMATANAFIEPISNASTSAQTPTAATDTYITGSAVPITAGRLQAGTFIRWHIFVSKTAAGTVAPIITIRHGTAGTTADTARCTLTMGVQTATVNAGVVLIVGAQFRSVGSGTSAVLQGGVGGSIAGFPTTGAAATSSGFDSTVTGTKIGLSVNTGTSAAWTITQVQADMLNVL